MLLQPQANPNKENADPHLQTQNGWTALMIASKNDHYQVVQLLLKEKLILNFKHKIVGLL